MFHSPLIAHRSTAVLLAGALAAALLFSFAGSTLAGHKPNHNPGGGGGGGDGEKTPVFTQAHHRFKDDVGGESDASWLAAEDANVTVVRNDPFRTRIHFRQGEKVSASVTPLLEYKLASGGSCADAAGWTAVTTSTTNAFALTDSANFTEPVATTEQLTSKRGIGFVSGELLDQTNPGSAISLNKKETEYSWNIKATDSAAAADYILRVSDNGTGFDAYAVCPQVTVPAPPTPPSFEQSGYRWFQNLNATAVGAPLAPQDTATAFTGTGNDVRLRMLLHVDGSDLAAASQSFNLQFADKGGDANCSAVASGNFSDITTSTAIAYNDNATPVDGDLLTANANDPLHSADTGSYWTEAVANANWDARLDHTSVVFDDGTNKMWVMGGSDPARTNDVWYSTDGITWTQATANANWVARDLHTSVVFNDGTNKMWVMGGRIDAARTNDVWYSTDGITWTQATANANWGERERHTSVVFNDGTNKMWVMGGTIAGPTRVNDVWYSTDGITWTQATANANWAARDAHTSVVFNDGTNKMWVIGGSTGTLQNDVWYSTDGITWTQATANAQWAGRDGHTSVVFNDGTNKMWVMGGNPLTNDVWYSPGNINQTYQELNPFTNSGASISAGADGMWDFALADNGAPGTTYCLRAVESDGTELGTYGVYPEISTAP